jgi:hypothetical protein
MKNKELKQIDLEKIFPEKLIPMSEDTHEDCSKCDNAQCKCDQIMENLIQIITLSDQIGHHELHNITLTIFSILQNLSTHEDGLLEIMSTCQKVFKELYPKDMGQTIN